MSDNMYKIPNWNFVVVNVQKYHLNKFNLKYYSEYKPKIFIQRFQFMNMWMQKNYFLNFEVIFKVQTTDLTNPPVHLKNQKIVIYFKYDEVKIEH